jgi:hypothetical protein
MKICVSAFDSKLANLAILKIASYHLAKGDVVKWYEPLFDQDCDKLYVSKIFTFSEEPIYMPNCEILRGGTGYDVKSTLPHEIESITNVSTAYQVLYPNLDYSIVFTTRGCVRKCEFCVVPIKEGLTHDVETVSLNPNGKYIELLDNNFFSSKNWEKRIDYLRTLNQPINFNTGIDVRTLTEQQAKELSTIKIKAIHIAWDNLIEEYLVRRGIELLVKYITPSKITCYVLVGFEQPEIIETDVYRVNEIYKYGVTPFAMGYIDFNNSKQERSQSVRNFQRWVNRYVFKKIKLKDYKANYKKDLD